MRLLLVVVTLLLVGCGDDASPGTMDREAFVEVWVALRAAAVGSDDGVLPPGERERILDAHGASADELAAFVDAHGDDVEFMDELWREVLDSLEARGLGNATPGPRSNEPARPGAGR